MNKRRTAEDALKMTPNVADFISGGLPSAEKQKVASDAKGDIESQTMGAKSERKQKTKAKRRTKIPEASSVKMQPSPAYDHTLLQARIQKSVRFLPQLIARFEEHCRDEIQSGRKPPTIQDALNEALRDWLVKSEILDS